MSLVQQVQQQLAALGRPLTAAQTILVGDGGRTLRIEFEAVDTLACSLRLLELSTPALAAADVAGLERTARALTDRLTYLLEPLSPIETDSLQAHVQCRSVPPERNEQGASYYELLVQRSGPVSLRRYRALGGQPRQEIQMHLTQQVLWRLIGDFDAVLA